MAEQKFEPKSESKPAPKPETGGGARPNVLATFGRATRSYSEELHNAWVTLNNTGRDAQSELHAKIAAANNAMASAAAHDRFTRAHHTYMVVQQAIAMGGSPEAWHHFKMAQDEYFDATKEISNLRDATQARIEEAHQEYAKSLQEATAEVQKRYEAAFRTFVAAQQAALKDLDVNAVDPGMLIEIGRNLMLVGDNARVNLAKT